MKSVCLSFLLLAGMTARTQLPCSGPEFRQFDFWLGDWTAYNNTNGNKAGDSRISVILDSCIILEEWTSANKTQGIRYAGKSYNKYNPRTKEWQQTWVDNVGGSTEFLHGKGSEGKMVVQTDPFYFKPDSLAIRRLSFYKLGNDKVRQHGEISKDDGKTWVTEYDLEYRRKEEPVTRVIEQNLSEMEQAYAKGDYERVASFYSDQGKIVGNTVEVSGRANLVKYWKNLVALGGSWKLTQTGTEKKEALVWNKGVSVITDKSGREHRVVFTLVWVEEGGDWKILQDAYW